MWKRQPACVRRDVRRCRRKIAHEHTPLQWRRATEDALKIGILIPEFPGQTHAFFWREMLALRELGIATELTSTRRPPNRLMEHAWAAQAEAETFYLSPPGFTGVLAAMAQFLAAGPKAWGRCLSAILGADVPRGIVDRARLVVLALVGARLLRHARRRHWDHVHVHSCADSANIAMFAWLLGNLPYSMTLHGPIVYFGSNQKQKWSRASFAIVITRTLLAEVQAHLNGALPRVEVAPMGVDLRQLTRAGGPYQPWNGQGPFRVFCCGRLNVGKGHEELLEAIAIVRKELDVQLRIAGEDEMGGSGYRRVLERRIEELALQDRVTLLGAVSEQTVRQELEQAHCFALASRQEALGVATMEAMAMQVPAVVTGVGGVAELVSSGVDGILVPAKDPQRLAEEILRVARDPSLATRLSQAAREKVERSFDSSVSAKTIARCLGYQPPQPIEKV